MSIGEPKDMIKEKKSDTLQRVDGASLTLSKVRYL
jgi:hypothetical protein